MTSPDPVQHVRDRARARREQDTERAMAVLRRHHPWAFRTLPDPALLVQEFGRFPVTVNFHPDRPSSEGTTAARSLAVTGVYRSQFETGTSSGSFSPWPGGDRVRWEEELFGPGPVDPTSRPRYGGLNLAGHADGACPRYGSCYLELHPRVLARSTLSVGGAPELPDDRGTVDEAMSLLAGLLEEADRTGQALRMPDGTVGGVVSLLRSPRPPRPTRMGRALDDYLEVQVHGRIRLDGDVTSVVVDPSFRGTTEGDELAAAAATHGVVLRWHRGFQVTPDDIDPAFRGAAVVALAERISDAESGPVTAAALGRWYRAHGAGPGEGTDGQHQLVKQLWHCLVEFGGPLA